METLMQHSATTAFISSSWPGPEAYISLIIRAICVHKSTNEILCNYLGAVNADSQLVGFCRLMPITDVITLVEQRPNILLSLQAGTKSLGPGAEF